MGYLPKDYDIKIPVELMNSILNQIPFGDELNYDRYKFFGHYGTFYFSYRDENFTIDYRCETQGMVCNQFVVKCNVISPNLIFNPSELILNKASEIQKIKDFLLTTIHNLYCERVGTKVDGFVKRDDIWYLVSYQRIDGVISNDKTLYLVSNHKFIKQLNGIQKLLKATLIGNTRFQKARSSRLSKIKINGVKYSYLSLEQMVAETCDPNYMRHVPYSKIYIDHYDYDSLVSDTIVDLSQLLSKVIGFSA
jgi:hypothetical protein